MACRKTFFSYRWQKNSLGESTIMTTTIPTEEAIRAMDGPALTRLAYALGLAPEWVHWDDAWEGDVPGPCGIDRWGIISPYTMPWHPHDDLTQAREVFLDKLPPLGCTAIWYAVENFGSASAKLSVTRYNAAARQASMRECLWGIGEPGNPAESSAAMAALRCACLVRAYQMQEEAHS